MLLGLLKRLRSSEVMASTQLKFAAQALHFTHPIRSQEQWEPIISKPQNLCKWMQWNFDAGHGKTVAVDTICLATGLTPLVELAWIAGCQFTYIPQLGGHLPMHNEYMETTVPGMYVAGDISGIEEASTAMEEGRLAGISAAAALGCYEQTTCEMLVKQAWERLDALRCGKFGETRKISKDRLVTLGKER